MCRRHVRGHGCVTSLESTARAAGDALAAQEYLHRRASRVRRPVYVRAGTAPSNSGRRLRRGSRHRPAPLSIWRTGNQLPPTDAAPAGHLGESAGAAVGQLLEGALVQIGEQVAQRPIELIEAKKALVAWPRNPPAHDHQHAVLDLVLVFGAASTSWQHGHLVVFLQVPVTGVDVRFVA